MSVKSSAEEAILGLRSTTALVAGELAGLIRFKEYFESFYGKGLEVINPKDNGSSEPFDNFIDGAIASMREKEKTHKRVFRTGLGALRADTNFDEETGLCAPYCPVYGDFVSDGHYGCEMSCCDEAFETYRAVEETKKSCLNCAHKDGCGYYADSESVSKSDKEMFEEHCVGCCCGDVFDCNRHDDGELYGCTNWEHKYTPENELHG